MKSILFILLFLALTFEADAQQANPRQPRDESRQRGGGGDPSPILTVLDSNGDRELSKEELANATSALKKLDRNEDGRLDEAEFKASASHRSDSDGSTRPPASGGDRPRTPWILVHALEIDANEDGVVEFESEMMAEANRVFAAYDRNNDEKITPDESGSKQGIPKSALGGFVREHAAELDRDQDGGISKAEMTAQFAKFFAQADKNGDQKLTKDEYEVEGGVVPRFPDRARDPNRPGTRNEPPAIRMRPAPPEASNPANRPVRSPRAPDTDLPDRPNIVLFLIDDMGWNAMGFTGNPWIETPRTDAMASQGMIFTNAYASAPNCAPTRACLMSGQYTPRHGVYTVVDDRHKPGLPHHKVLAADSNAELATESVTIAESLKAEGYATGMFGMWNLGRGRSGPTTPLGQGFEIFKQPRDLGFEKDRYFNDRGEYLTDAFTEEGIRWIEANHEEKPFFLYLAYHGVHSPFEPKPDLLKKYREKPGGTGAREEAEYAATVEAVDQNVGRIVDALERLGLDDDTIVIFHSDNGGNRQYIEPLAGGKGTLYEGGIRVPTAIWGPGVAVGEATAPMLSMDLYPTILDLTGTPTPERHRLDGETLRPILTGESDRLKRDSVFWHFPSYIGGGGPSSAMRQEDWKLIEHFDGQRFEVFDLSRDPQERRNLLEEEPEKAQELVANLRRWQEQTNAPRPIEANPAYDVNAQPVKGRENRKKGEKRRQ